jgi:hypothetical protein
MDEMPDFLKKMLEQMHVVEFNLTGGDRGSWINVAQLKPEDILKKKELDMKRRRAWSKIKVLSSKIQVQTSAAQADQDEFWDGIYETYSLPANLPYKVDETGQVVKYVPPAPAENA